METWEAAMRFGLYTDLQNPPGKPHAETYAEWLEQIEQADRLGYSSYSLIEHPWYEQFSIASNPLALFSAAAQRTRQIRLRTTLHVLPLHNPARLAGDIAAVDILSGGRLECGVGRGHAWLYPPAQLPVAESAGRFREALAVLLLAWTQDRFSYEGQYYRFRDVSVVPKPLQRPHPPLLVGGGSERTQREAGARGWALLLPPNFTAAQLGPRMAAYRETCADHGHLPRLIAVRPIYLDHDAARAEADAREPVEEFFHKIASPIWALPPTDDLRAAGYDAYAGDHFPRMARMTYQEAVAGEIAYVGTPAQVTEQVAHLRELGGVAELSVVANFGGLASWQVLRTQELFAREVNTRLG
jgi:alkanesulfonate monooxygenase SsuD/methylene tetrahydromethanopterin reductase-like flavin-dependent oxidoreductase (luciferase family)